MGNVCPVYLTVGLFGNLFVSIFIKCLLGLKLEAIMADIDVNKDRQQVAHGKKFVLLFPGMLSFLVQCTSLIFFQC